MITGAERIALLRRLQSCGVKCLDFRVSLVGDYSEDDERKRWRVLPSSNGAVVPLRSYSGRTPEEAIERLLEDLQVLESA